MKRIWNAFCMGLGMFTALPCPYRPWDDDARDLMLVMLPLVGENLIPSLSAALNCAPVRSCPSQWCGKT